ncbi:MAG: VWA domain-containing protein [Acidimicrobiales bacterium]
MTFFAPWRLLLLLGILALGVTYLVLSRRRSRYALRFASADLLASIAPERPGWRRHVPAALHLLALTVLVVGFARPARFVLEPRERATVIVAIDTSLSMQATDVQPDRLTAAKEAAERFVTELPPTLNVGVVSFAGTASVLVTPTQDRTAAINAIRNLQLAESTAIGEAIFTSLDALSNAPPDETGTPPPARIVLLSDGETTVGRPDSQAVAAAATAEVPVSTIAFGTEDGTITYDDPTTPEVEADVIPVPVGDDNLEAIAEGTGGSFFAATSLEELDAVYADIGSAIGYEEVEREITDWFVGAGLLVLAVASGLGLAWFNRLP